MLAKRTVISIILVALIFTGALFTASDMAMGASTNLSWGSKGTEVVQLQNTLNSRGYWCGSADGVFGAKTYDAVVKFQNKQGLTADGVVGSQTRDALGLSGSSSVQVSRGAARTLTMVATAYTDDAAENWPWAGAPSYIGLPLARGIVAVDPKVIPMGSKLYIEGYGEAIAADQGGAIKGNRIDLFMDSKSEAYAWGMRTVKVTVY